MCSIFTTQQNRAIAAGAACQPAETVQNPPPFTSEVRSESVTLTALWQATFPSLNIRQILRSANRLMSFMHRFSLRFSATLITFVVGSGVAFLGLAVVQTDPVDVAPVPDIVRPPEQRPIPAVEAETQESDEDYICGGLDDIDYFQPAITKGLRGGKFKGKPMRPPLEYRSADDAYFPSLVDVNGDGRKELAIQAWCAPVGNCELWILKKNGNDYRVLLRSLPGSVQTFKFLRTRSHGFFDLETRDHGDAWSGGIAIYKYDGRKYKARSCSTYSYSYLKNGKLTELQNPIIKRVPCNQE